MSVGLTCRAWRNPYLGLFLTFPLRLQLESLLLSLFQAFLLLKSYHILPLMCCILVVSGVIPSFGMTWDLLEEVLYKMLDH